MKLLNPTSWELMNPLDTYLPTSSCCFPSVITNECPETAIARRNPHIAANLLSKQSEDRLLEALAVETTKMKEYSLEHGFAQLDWRIEVERPGFFGRLRERVYKIRSTN
jgi:hypothetical protein